MAEWQPDLKEEALASLQAGRQEITEEAQWLRHELSPKHVMSRLVERHTVSTLAIAFTLGLVVSMKLKRKRPTYDVSDVKDHAGNLKVEQSKPASGIGPIIYLAGAALKFGIPFLLKRQWSDARAELRQDPLSSPATIPNLVPTGGEHTLPPI